MADTYCLIFDTVKESISVKPLQYITSRNLVNVCRGTYEQQYIPIGYAETEDVANEIAQESSLRKIILQCLHESEDYEALKADRLNRTLEMLHEAEETDKEKGE